MAPVSEKDLQLKILYAMVVAGKNAEFANRVMEKLFGGIRSLVKNPFEWIREWIKEDQMFFELCLAHTGNYQKLKQGFTELVQSGICLATCSAEELEKIHGIGPKSARFFIVWTRPTARCAVLDVHVLRWLTEQGYKQVPPSTPSAGAIYDKWEKVFLEEADKRGKLPRELDLEIWLKGSGTTNEIPKMLRPY